MTAIIQTKLTFKELLKRAFALFKENFKLILIIVLIIYVPLNLILEAVPVDFEQAPLQSLKTYLRVAQLLDFLIGIIAAMAIAYVVKQKLRGATVTWQEALKKSLSRWPAAIGTSLLAGICLIGLTLLLIVPGIIFALYWAFAAYVVVLNDKSGWSALKYSKSVVQGRWWQVFGKGLGLGAIFILISVLIFIPIGYFLPDFYVLNVIFDLFTDLIASFLTVAWVLLYLHLEETQLRNA